MDIGIFYCALELRFTFEQVIIKHANASYNYSNAFEKLHWKPEKLFKAISDEFHGRVDLTKSYKFYLQKEKLSPEIIFGYFLPIEQNLFSEYGQLDNYLHAQWAIEIGRPNNEWQKENAVFLREFANKLIPHANPKNSLDFINLPGINIADENTQNLSDFLLKYWN